MAHARKILVAGEGRLVQEVLERLPARGEYDVAFAADAREAMGMISADRPDMVILDLIASVGGMTDACRMIRQVPETRLLPVMVVVAEGAEEDEISGLDSGADDCMAKPLDAAELKARIAGLLRRCERD